MMDIYPYIIEDKFLKCILVKGLLEPNTDTTLFNVSILEKEFWGVLINKQQINKTHEDILEGTILLIEETTYGEKILYEGIKSDSIKITPLVNMEVFHNHIAEYEYLI
ncbi:hypothetical protein [Bacillus pseudomycoides]|uniref:hypothetical protein n=1 Tax=Bacillus pseudomycoides TaxID=64104 RepID=UPI000BF9A61F|nr:hypothetical protein [Bacillus pseudomycoides]PGD73706.1 hypothetical protein COM46_21750 [Bacillus pseudomycoides]